MSRVIFGRHKTAACFLVQTMDDAGSLFSADARQGRAVAEQRVHQSVLAVACARVDGQAGGLIDNDEIVVLEKHIKRNRFWPNVDLLHGWLGQIDLVAGSYNLPWPGGRAVDTNKA